jgi:hypothetical protein
LIKCPVCEAIYSYGRFIYHDCDNHSIYFGKIFEKKQKVYKWNCNTPLISLELMNKQIKSIASTTERLPVVELKENKQYTWNCDYTAKLNSFQIQEKKYNSLYSYE